MQIEEALSLLNIDHPINESKLNSSYRIKSLEYHPDRLTGNNEMFLKVQEAYNILKEADNIGDLLFIDTFTTSFPNPMNVPINEKCIDRNKKYSFTIPIKLYEFYYNKMKTVKLKLESGEKIIDFYPINTRKIDNIYVRPRIINETDDLTLYNGQLIKLIKISLSEFLYKTEFEVQLFKDKFTVKRTRIENDKLVYFTDTDFSVKVPGKGLLLPNGNRNDLIIKFMVIIVKKDFIEYADEVINAFP